MTLTSCDNDDIILGGADTGVLESPEGNVVYVTDDAGKSDDIIFDIDGSGTINLFARTSRAIQGDCAVTFNYDASLLDAYNADHKTNYTAVPQNLVSFGNGGTATFSAGALTSSAMPLTVSSNGQLDPEKVYALPVSYSVAGGTIVGGDSSMMILVRDASHFPGADKLYEGNPGMKVMAVVEVNDHNPLNVMGFTIDQDGKQLFDYVVLFSANINYNASTGRVYVSRNDNVQAILDNADKYIRPLQERGIKVILGILGNHDASGISTLTPATSKVFAQEVKQVCDAYGLDGVFLDDEYSDYSGAGSGMSRLFQAASYEAASRMAYDIKHAMPDRLVIGYKYNGLAEGVEIDGESTGEFFDYVVNDYWDTTDPTATFPGLRQNQAGTGSWNCSDWSQCIPSSSNWTRRFSLEGMREEGYGIMMVYNLIIRPDYWMTPYIVKDLGKTAKAFYNAELRYDGSYYPKDYNN